MAVIATISGGIWIFRNIFDNVMGFGVFANFRYILIQFGTWSANCFQKGKIGLTFLLVSNRICYDKNALWKCILFSMVWFCDRFGIGVSNSPIRTWHFSQIHCTKNRPSNKPMLENHWQWCCHRQLSHCPAFTNQMHDSLSICRVNWAHRHTHWNHSLTWVYDMWIWWHRQCLSLVKPIEIFFYFIDTLLETTNSYPWLGYLDAMLLSMVACAWNTQRRKSSNRSLHSHGPE